ncbi:MAG: hypothetical protein M3Y85_11200 [Bacteroidota bacterium]|nr:hypothetical protein [Bacteroidota bacterium]
MKPFLLFIAFLFVFQTSFAQEDSADKKTATVGFNLSYLSNSVYLGRKDSSTISYLTPGLRYSTPSGFFVAAGASFLTQENRIDLISLEAGYEFSKKNLEGGLTVYQSFYSSQSENVKAELNTSLDAYAGYLFPFIKPVISGSISLGSSNPDYTASFGLEHSFATNDETFYFTPKVFVNASSQNYYDSYYQKRTHGKKRGTASVTNITQSLAGSKFKVMDFELTGAAEYKAGDFSFSFEPVYAIPVNPNVIVTTVKPQSGPSTTKTVTETLNNSFYFTLGVSYNLNLKKH